MDQHVLQEESSVLLVRWHTYGYGVRSSFPDDCHQLTQAVVEQFDPRVVTILRIDAGDLGGWVDPGDTVVFSSLVPEAIQDDLMEGGVMRVVAVVDTDPETIVTVPYAKHGTVTYPGLELVAITKDGLVIVGRSGLFQVVR